VLHEERIQREPVPLRDDPTQRGLRLLGAPRAHDAEAVGEAVDVGIDRHSGDAVAEHQDAVRGLRTDPGKARQLLERPGDALGESLEERAGARLDRAGLGPVEADRPDQPLDRRGARGRQGPRVGEPREQAGGGDVGLLVARSLGKDGSDQHLERVLGVVAQVRATPVAGPVERRQPVEELLPVERRGAGRHRPRAGDASLDGTVSVPGSERSGSSVSPFGRISSPTR